jgi:membrane-associated phospholipid phosphatase
VHWVNQLLSTAAVGIADLFLSKKADILDGRRSFPSGHSSAVFAGMAFLSLWLAGQTAAWCFHAPVPAASLRSSRLGRFSLTLLPLSWAVFVAVTRLEGALMKLAFLKT